jgi:hypothetical protein
VWIMVRYRQLSGENERSLMGAAPASKRKYLGWRSFNRQKFKITRDHHKIKFEHT